MTTAADKTLASSLQASDEVYLMQGNETLDRKATLSLLSAYFGTVLVASVNGQTGVAVLTTSEITEGTNLYFTNSRAQTQALAVLSAPSDASLSYSSGSFSLNIAHSNYWTAEQFFGGGIACTSFYLVNSARGTGTEGAITDSILKGSSIGQGIWATTGIRLDQIYTPVIVLVDAATVNLDLSLGDNFELTTTAAVGTNRILTVTNGQAGQRFALEIFQDSVGSRTVTWFTVLTGSGTATAAIKWAGGGTAPTLTLTALKADQFLFYRRATGEVQGFVVGQNI